MSGCTLRLGMPRLGRVSNISLDGWHICSLSRLCATSWALRISLLRFILSFDDDQIIIEAGQALREDAPDVRKEIGEELEANEKEMKETE